MRRPSGAVPQNELSYMWDRHREIVRRLAAGDRQKDIALDMGMTQSRMSVIANSPIVRVAVDKLHDVADEKTTDIDARLKLLRADAVDAMEEVLKKKVEQGNVSLRIRVAESILDRTGHGKQEKSSDRVVSLESYVQQTLVQLRRGEPALQEMEPASLVAPERMETATFMSPQEEVSQREE